MTRGRARTPRRRWRIALFAGLLLLAAGVALGWSPAATLAARLSLKTDAVIAELGPDPYYEELVPRYVEICATSQWRKKIGGQGNPFGHALMYIKGACKAEGTAFPQLRQCRRVATSVADPEHGVGVSVGRFFKNVNWIAIPGYDRFHTGGILPGETLDAERLDATVRSAIEAGIFDGVELHEGWESEGQESLADFVAIHSAGTDFALTFARNVFCARVPVTETQMGEMIAFLNDKNTEYATGEADYNWNLFWNNCVHTVRNALAAANIWEPIAVWNVRLRSLFNLAVPANEFVNLAILGADGPLEDYRDILDDGPARDTLHEMAWLPTRHGALVKMLPAHDRNELFDPEFRLFAVQSLLRMGAAADTLRLMSDLRYVDLEANLVAFLERYRAIEDAHQARREPLASVRGDRHRRVSRLHLDYIRDQRADAEAMLDRLRALKASGGAAGQVTPGHQE